MTAEPERRLTARRESRRPESAAPDLAFRPMRGTDLPAVLAIERASFSVPWSGATFRDLLANPGAAALVAETDGEVVGYAVSWQVAGEAELGDLAVVPDRRRRGIGRGLLRRAETAAREDGAGHMFLEVRESNEAARALYRDAGYRPVGRRRGYYRRPAEDALILRKPLAPAGVTRATTPGRGRRADGPVTDP